jgi:hypothetical protein
LPRPSFEDQLAFGREVEKSVSAWLMTKGYIILPVYDYSGLSENKAPKFTAAIQAESLVIPDLLAAKEGSSKFVEVKFKESATFTHITKRNETGLSHRLWKDYKSVQEKTGIPVYLVFAHRKEDEVRCGKLSSLDGKERVYSGTRMGRGGMVFFDYESLALIGKLSEIAPELFVK